MKRRAVHPTLATWAKFRLTNAALGHSRRVRRAVAAVAEVSDYIDWQRTTFESTETLPTKWALWKAIATRMRATDSTWHVMEFGVAFGNATQWWLSHHDSALISTWDGFDLFTGLPRAWRDQRVGAFDTGGQTPSIDDDRLTWHVGDVADTIEKMDGALITSGRRLAYFDFDIYEPSKIAWDWLLPHLRSGDILYFDEAFDADERRLLIETVLPAGSYEFIGATPLSLAIEIVSLN